MRDGTQELFLPGVRFLRGRVALVCGLFFCCSASAQILNIEDRRIRLADSVHLAGFVDAGFSVYHNNQTTATARLTAQGEYLKGRHFLLGVAQYDLIKSGAQRVLNEGFQHLRYDYGFHDRWVFEAYEQIQYNEQIAMQSRNLVGAGLRFKLSKSFNRRVVAGLSYMFESERFKDSASLHINHRLSSYIAFIIKLSRDSKFVSTTYYQPKITDFSSRRVSSTASLLFKFTKNLVFNASFNLTDDVDRELSNIQPVVYSLTNGARWNF